jgi:hypothetical protein
LYSHMHMSVMITSVITEKIMGAAYLREGQITGRSNNRGQTQLERGIQGNIRPLAVHFSLISGANKGQERQIKDKSRPLMTS